MVSVLIERPNAAVVAFGSMLVLAMLLVVQTPPAAAQRAKSGAAGTHRAPPAQIERGKQVYLESCLACHQVDGGGVMGMNPPLIKTKWVLGDNTTLIQVVLKGMAGEVEINGDTYHNVMAPHSDLTDQQIADVLTYIRHSFGNKAKAVTVAEVKAVRAQQK